MTILGFDATLVRRERTTGIERYALELLRHLGEIVPEEQPVRVFCRPEGRERLAGLPRHFGLVVSPTDNRVVTDQLWLPVAARRAGVALMHHPAMAPGLWPSCPFVLTVHDLTHRFVPDTLSTGGRYYYAPLLERALRSPHLRRILTVSRASAADIARLYGKRPEEIAVTPNGVSERFQPASPAEITTVRDRYALPDRFVLTVGTIEPRKNLRVAVEAFTTLASRHRDLQLAVVGRQGWGTLHIPREAAERIRVLGHVSDEDLAALYSACEVFVLPSCYEGFGLPLAEAIACGAPCVASAIPSLQEVGGDASLYAEPNEPAHFADRIDRLLRDRPARAELSRRGGGRVANWNWQETARRTFETYVQALGLAPSSQVSAKSVEHSCLGA